MQSPHMARSEAKLAVDHNTAEGDTNLSAEDGAMVAEELV